MSSPFYTRALTAPQMISADQNCSLNFRFRPSSSVSMTSAKISTSCGRRLFRAHANYSLYVYSPSKNSACTGTGQAYQMFSNLNQPKLFSRLKSDFNQKSSSSSSCHPYTAPLLTDGGSQQQPSCSTARPLDSACMRAEAASGLPPVMVGWQILWKRSPKTHEPLSKFLASPPDMDPIEGLQFGAMTYSLQKSLSTRHSRIIIPRILMFHGVFQVAMQPERLWRSARCRCDPILGKKPWQHAAVHQLTPLLNLLLSHLTTSEAVPGEMRMLVKRSGLNLM